MSTLKEQIKKYMLKLISANDKKLTAKTMEAFSGRVSKSSLYNYLGELLESGSIEKQGSGYKLKSKEYGFCYKNERLDENRVYRSDIYPIFEDFPRNVTSIWAYAFTEMMNNAIEHSSAENISVTVITNDLKTAVIISDDGKGIFKNIQEFILAERGETLTLKECASLLFAGKFTTARQMHSGEGIFFTSHLMDSFKIYSDGVVFTRDDFLDLSFEVEELDEKSTTVIMELDNSSNKTAIEVFNRFSSVDDGFIKTKIPISHFFPGMGPISRSEGRRLGELLLKFKEAELDFSGVSEIGQAFAHELFVVWQSNHPDISLVVTNACPEVDFMIKRAINTKY